MEHRAWQSIGQKQRDPFYAYSITKEETKRGFLSKEEINLLIKGTFKKPSYTGWRKYAMTISRRWTENAITPTRNWL